MKNWNLQKFPETAIAASCLVSYEDFNCQQLLNISGLNKCRVRYYYKNKADTQKSSKLANLPFLTATPNPFAKLLTFEAFQIDD